MLQTGSLQWVEQLSANVKALPVQAWRPWTLGGGERMGGYVVEFGRGQFSSCHPIVIILS